MRETWPQTAAIWGYRAFVFGLGALGLVFLTAPIAIGLIMSFTSGQTLKFPPDGFSLRWYAALLDPVRSGTEHIAAFNSLKIAGLAVLVSLIFAVPASIGMAKMRGKAVALVEPMLLAPLVLPSLVYGLAALITANMIGLRPSLGLVVAGHVVIFGPLVYRATLAIAARMDPALEEASTTLGAGKLTTLRRVTLPLLAPGILAGAFLVFVESLDNVSISLFLADARTTVLPLRMFAMIEESLDVRVASMSGILIGVVLLGLLIGRRLLAGDRPNR
jgi:putative spermidine/putrescine transport system permease protein